MKCILMNKNTEVLSCDFNEVSKFFDKIYEVYNIDYAPYILKKFYILLFHGQNIFWVFVGGLDPIT